jgi:hypothetical protein
MPTLFRFLSTIVFLAGLVFAGMIALVTFVQPKQGEISTRVPIEDTGPSAAGQSQ